MLETIVILGFVAFMTVLTTAGWVLFLFFGLRGAPRATRSLAAALLGSGGLLVPILGLGGGGFGGEGVGVMLLAVIAFAGLVGLPTALLANRKLEHAGASAAAAFE
jgi:hypothetical protein